MGMGFGEIIMTVVVGLFTLGMPIAAVIFGVVIYRKLDRIERLLQDRDE